MKKIVVIGGGASGIAAAIAASTPSFVKDRPEVILLEGLDKVGKKILATGNGRCNLTNSQISTDHYYSSSPKAMAQFLKDMPTEQALTLFRSYHMLTAEEDMGRIYPHTRMASTVRDVLLGALEQSGVTVKTEHKVTSVAPKKKGGFQVCCENGADFHADTVILSAGGQAAPKQGTNGDGFKLAKQLGHTIVPIYPCLTAFRSDAKYCKGLKGVRAHGELKLSLNGSVWAKEAGEIQFTDYGISGIPAFQLSCHMKPGRDRAALSVDLVPFLDLDQLIRLLREARFKEDRPFIDALPIGLIHPKLLSCAFEVAKIPKSTLTKHVTYQQYSNLAKAIKDLPFPVSGVQGWEQAQVTGGGVSLDEINQDFSSKLHPGLYLTGEVLDVVGECGGYNLHWAWASGVRAGLFAKDSFEKKSRS